MSHTRAEHLASQIEACMTGGKLFTRKMMEQTRDELRRLDAENEPLRQARAVAKGSKPRARGKD